MQSILSRPQTMDGPSGSSYRVPRKSSSFLSLRREKEKPTPSLDSHPPTFESPGSSNRSRPSYFDAYPRAKITTTTRLSKSKVRRSSPTRSPSRSVSACPEQLERSSGGRTSTEPAYVFPSFDSTEDFDTSATPKPYARTRSRTGPSRRSKWEDPSIDQIRFSGSSSTQHTETPPRTPVDINPSLESFEHFPVVVAAPISGVETMDALVDGMNGRDDILLGGAGISNRSRFGIPGHHPLYQPPLPTPPPGIILGGGKMRRKSNPPANQSSDSGDDGSHQSVSSRPRRRRPRAFVHRTASDSTISPLPSADRTSPQETSPSVLPYDTATLRRPASPSDKRKSVVPSISEIIRSHAPPESHVWHRPSTARSSSLYAHSQGHATVHEEPESEPEPLNPQEEAEMMSRSSIDSVADEVQRTLRNQVAVKPPPPAPPSSFPKRHSTISDNASIYSPRSDPGVGTSYSSSIASYHPPPSPFDTASFISLSKRPSASQEVAQYLRSSRLTTLLKLTRSPHASHDNPLTVSLSDLGCPTGHPVVVFLGLGCVRHIMGLYDEMAECLNLRLITIDRWGLGRTEPRAKSAKGIMQWASAVEEVLDLLHIDKCSVMAHSAGAPYALSFANKIPSRIRGDVCLLAPWVGGSEGNSYKWLKYVPNGILKTAQAAEWKIQAWMIGKPPTIAYEGIGFNAQSPVNLPISDHQISTRSNGNLDVYPSALEGRPRPSIGSSSFSEYDDLGDFEGRFESRSTLGAGGTYPSSNIQGGNEKEVFVNKRKPSRGFLNRFKGSSNSPQSPEGKSQPGGKKLKALRSMGSLKGRSQSSKKSVPSSPQLPPALQIEVNLGLNDLDWMKSNSETSLAPKDSFTATSPKFSILGDELHSSSTRRRSISFTPPKPALSLPASPSPTTHSSFIVSMGPDNAYQAALGNALIAASHSESARGTHSDLLQILNHENHPWGFSYSSYPHTVKIWYGDKDERIAENAVRWMEHIMGEDRCSVVVVQGADHGLMYRSSVVVEVLEHALSFWKPDY